MTPLDQRRKSTDILARVTTSQRAGISCFWMGDEALLARGKDKQWKTKTDIHSFRRESRVLVYVEHPLESIRYRGQSDDRQRL